MKTILFFFFILFISIANASNYYWVGGTGSWSDYANHWATTSGGSTFNAHVPSSSNDVFFDVNSFSASGQTVTVDPTIAYCKNMDWTGVTNTPQFSAPSSITLKIFGSLTLSGNENFLFYGSMSFEAFSTGHYINTNGDTLYCSVGFNGIGGEWTLLNNLFVMDLSIFLNAGSFILNHFQVSCFYFGSNNYNLYRSLDMRGSRIILSSSPGNDVIWSVDSNLVLFSDSSFIQMGASDINHFESESQSYDTILVDKIGTPFGQNDAHFTLRNCKIKKLKIISTGTQVTSSENLVIDSLIDKGPLDIYQSEYSNINYAFIDGNLSIIPSSNYYSNFAIEYLHVTGYMRILSTSGIEYHINKLIVDGNLSIYPQPNQNNHNILDCTLNADATIQDWNTFSILRLTPSHTYTFGSGTSQTITDTLDALGQAGFPIELISDTIGKQATLIIGQNPFCSDYLYIRDIKGVGNSLYAGANSDNVFDNSGWIFTACSVGIEEINSNSNITIYPNPLISSSILQLNVQVKDAEVVIYDMLGKEMVRKKMNGDRMEIEKGSLEAGVYFVRVRIGERQWVEKIVVQ